ncbi:lipid II flippase FtsW [bacterium BMS3Abin08]|nr:lipid II flippase FtsW [bacterium BMS3Abin08]
MYGSEKGVDKYFLLSVVALTIMGVVMVYSSTALINISKAGTALSSQGGSQFMYLKKHLMTLLIAFLAMLLFYAIKPSTLRRYSIVFLALSFVLLLLVFIPGLGVKINGARRWIRLWPSTVQPGEFVKVAMVLFLARYLSDTQEIRDRFSVFFRPLLVMLSFQAVLLLQPDFGGAFTLGLITFAMFYISGTPLRFMFTTLLFVLPVVVKLVMEPYRLKRIFIFLDPWKDPYAGGFQLVQSFIALGNGGFGGVGLGESKQKLSYLPEVNTDFIFSMVGEEIGFIGVVFVLFMFVMFFSRGIKIAGDAKSLFCSYLAHGLTLMITLQALMNIAVVTGLVPTKGLPLPFLSYGGSSLLVNFIAVSVMLKISRGDDEQLSVQTQEMIIKRRAHLKARRLRRKAQ